MQLICPVILKLERCIPVMLVFVDYYDSVIVQAMKEFFVCNFFHTGYRPHANSSRWRAPVLRGVDHSQSPAKKCQEVI